MDYAAAQQHWLDTMATQQALAALSDDPGQFRRDPMSALLRQAWNERFGRSDDYLNWKF